MKEIKFRAKTIKGNHWVYGHYFVSPLTDGDSGTNPKDGWYFLTGEKRHCIANENGVVFVIDPKTLGQYTGLKDKNGKEIYEGDIVKFQMTREILITSPMVATSKETAVYQGAIKWGEYGWRPFEDGKVESIEIIGNIHSNPELLK